MKEKEKKKEKKKKAKKRIRGVKVPILNLPRPPCPVLFDSEVRVYDSTKLRKFIYLELQLSQFSAKSGTKKFSFFTSLRYRAGRSR